jgi:isoleucyl-tRNA synthetase
MEKKFPEYKQLDLAAINLEILERWNKQGCFEKSIETREGRPDYVFYEGPPSANGIPGIHHVMARTIKDLFCRYKTMKGFRVERKAGWDTHGLPVELGVEKAMGITKEDIGKNISIEEYNNACRKDVMKYTDLWVELTQKMGYWVDMGNPYITYDNRYIETLWWLLSELFRKGLLYKGYTIQPYSPAAGTGLSSHELNLPGCYKQVKDTTVVAQFLIKKTGHPLEKELENFTFGNLYFLAWTTTPWTLPSNTALAVGKDISYQVIETFNQYTYKPVTVILARERVSFYFPEKNASLSLSDYKEGDKNIPFKVVAEYTGAKLQGLRYEQLLPYKQPESGDAFLVVAGDFVTTEDGTGIVHIAPSFGADDFRTARQQGLGALTMVDKTGRFIPEMGEFAGRFVKNEYDIKANADTKSVDIDIAIKLKEENKAFRIEKYEHSYPHCWRTDKPILYYPLDSWFIRTTALKERMIELNKTINWKPASTGTGRFGQWLENLVDWNLSRSRYWGTPLPIWRSEDGDETLCIGSVAELKAECEKSVKAGFMKKNPLAAYQNGDHSSENYNSFDLHRPFVDQVILVSASGKKMIRETDLIDVWFDSGAMPYAQLHYPFEHKEDFGKHFPADFIAEGVDQTRGWFFTLHAISVMISDSVSYKNIVSNGLVLDKDGNKMSKRLGNAVDPYSTMAEFGADPLRWYMISNSQPWDNLKFDKEGIDEVKRKFFGTLYNTYNFFALYANIDGFKYKEERIPVAKRAEIDRWIISLLNSLIREVEDHYQNYEPTKAARAIQHFVIENLSNWYVRLNRKRYWGGEYAEDKIAAYQTLFECLLVVSKLSAPVIPFYADKLYLDLTGVTETEKFESVHLGYFPERFDNEIDTSLEERMDIAQTVSSLVLGLRRKVNIKVRQPLSRIMVPVLEGRFHQQFESVKELILNEVNVKEVEYITEDSGVLVKKIKPNFKTLGPRFGKAMKEVAAAVLKMSPVEISQLERDGRFVLSLQSQQAELNLEDVEILSEDIPGWQVASAGKLTVALDISVSEALRQEGIAREFINRIQNLRKDSGFEVTDKIKIHIMKQDAINQAIIIYSDYIATQTLATEVVLKDFLEQNSSHYVEIDTDITTHIHIERVMQK